MVLTDGLQFELLLRCDVLVVADGAYAGNDLLHLFHDGSHLAVVIGCRGDGEL